MCHSQQRHKINTVENEKKGGHGPPRRSSGYGDPDETTTSLMHIVPCPPVVREGIRNIS
jgi:hypothetical protein